MKVYRIFRTPARSVICEVHDAMSSWSLQLIGHHSPTGFEFGYMGSGPAELALCILRDYFEESVTAEDIARRPIGQMAPACEIWHQDFKQYFLGLVPRIAVTAFEISEESITSWLEKQRKDRDREALARERSSQL